MPIGQIITLPILSFYLFYIKHEIRQFYSYLTQHITLIMLVFTFNDFTQRHNEAPEDPQELKNPKDLFLGLDQHLLRSKVLEAGVMSIRL